LAVMRASVLCHIRCLTKRSTVGARAAAKDAGQTADRSALRPHRRGSTLSKGGHSGARCTDLVAAPRGRKESECRTVSKKAAYRDSGRNRGEGRGRGEGEWSCGAGALHGSVPQRTIGKWKAITPGHVTTRTQLNITEHQENQAILGGRRGDARGGQSKAPALWIWRVHEEADNVVVRAAATRGVGEDPSMEGRIGNNR